MVLVSLLYRAFIDFISCEWRRYCVGNSNACPGRRDDMKPWTGTHKRGGNRVFLPVQREFEHQPPAGNSVPRDSFLSGGHPEEERAAAREPTLGLALEAARFDSPAIEAIHQTSPAGRPMPSAQIRPRRLTASAQIRPNATSPIAHQPRTMLLSGEGAS